MPPMVACLILDVPHGDLSTQLTITPEYFDPY